MRQVWKDSAKARCRRVHEIRSVYNRFETGLCVDGNMSDEEKCAENSPRIRCTKRVVAAYGSVLQGQVNENGFTWGLVRSNAGVEMKESLNKADEIRLVRRG